MGEGEVEEAEEKSEGRWPRAGETMTQRLNTASRRSSRRRPAVASPAVIFSGEMGAHHLVGEERFGEG